MHRVMNSDVILILSDRTVNDKNHVNRSMIRTATDRYWSLTVPVETEGLPADESRVDTKMPWKHKLFSDTTRAYTGLNHLDEVQHFTKHCFDGVEGDALVDWLLAAFVATMKMLKWDRKQIFRGDTLQRRRYSNESEFLLNLALESESDRLIVGRTQKVNLNQRLFQRNQVDLELQNWYGNKKINSRDSILDMIARYGAEGVEALFQ